MSKLPSPVDHPINAAPSGLAFCWAQELQCSKMLGHPRIDWSRAPSRAHWWAMDANGEAHWFVDPRVSAFETCWRFEVAAAPNFGFLGDYKQSLTERPSK